MRILIVGANGMIGHRLWLAAREVAETWGTIRDRPAGQPWLELFDVPRLIPGVHADDPASFDRALAASRPDVVINAIGLIKQRAGAFDPGAAFNANCLVPHYVASRCEHLGARLIHISTDCVFRGERGRYSEADRPDALDTYGLTKRLGEVGAPHLTVRTSVIGRSLAGSTGLLEWLLAQRGSVGGWRRAIFSGLATPMLANTLIALAVDHPRLEGTWHVASEPIDKYNLLRRMSEAFRLPLDVVPVDEPAIDRSLDDTRFRWATGIARPSWDEMIERLASDPTPYPRLRGERAGRAA